MLKWTDETGACSYKVGNWPFSAILRFAMTARAILKRICFMAVVAPSELCWSMFLPYLQQASISLRMTCPTFGVYLKSWKGISGRTECEVMEFSTRCFQHAMPLPRCRTCNSVAAHFSRLQVYVFHISSKAEQEDPLNRE